jgi:hypothetical protein
MKLPVRVPTVLITMLAMVPLVSAAPAPTAVEHDGPDPDAVLPASSASAAVTADRVTAVSLAAAAFGNSGALRTMLVAPGAPVHLPLVWAVPWGGEVAYHWRPVLGTVGDGATGTLEGSAAARAPLIPGVYELELHDDGVVHEFGPELRVVVTVPFERKRNGRIGPYHMGTWPTEGKERKDGYAPPAGFIEVTPENQSLPLSRHFQLREFLTKDQDDVWPKYVAVDPRLVDKLELVLLELRDMGIRADRMVVMSGFRTPHYNRYRLGNPPSSLSRHQFGDAADVWVDNEGDWHMSDLNGDGRRDLEDARVILRAVERVERRHPELVGGAGLYRANRARGPFIHIDVRGRPARW